MPSAAAGHGFSTMLHGRPLAYSASRNADAPPNNIRAISDGGTVRAGAFGDLSPYISNSASAAAIHAPGNRKAIITAAGATSVRSPATNPIRSACTMFMDDLAPLPSPPAGGSWSSRQPPLAASSARYPHHRPPRAAPRAPR